MAAVAQTHRSSITKFLAWHSRIVDLDDQHSTTLTNDDWQLNRLARRVRHLRIALDDVALANGATHIEAGDGGELRLNAPNPNFDWRHGQINYSPAEDRWEPEELRGEALIAELVEVTGIPS